MRWSVRELVQLVASSVPVEGPVYELGSYQVQPPALSDLRPLFPWYEYVGCDVRPGPGVDRIEDLRRLTLPDECAGAVLCLDTLEHVEYPREAVAEMHRILRPGGLLVLVTVMGFPIHEYPHDYWRFTPSGLESLLAPFGGSVVGSAGAPLFPHTVYGVAWKGPSPLEVVELERGLKAWKARWRQNG